MNPDKLIRMANQIAAFFRSYPEDQAMAGIRDHMVAFWTPGMRRQILAHANLEGPGLDPLVAKALRTFQVAESPIEKGICRA
ncbi:formate dehydrogenase subunit delta [Microvirga pudoricolor]|uniref:formate dehydrogenase subunit delta n=1 Tax=Microvirga pudoricolor TaxID=2778729 RepID=UPI00194F85E8|nr:formate dehydrogenase subunit delta [Microvirga pudoricolor]MBM6595686.1 formate dehydrogenase subunit delta [Microvirga pudoricolor]